jgi:superfamily II DNA helicase RecQ
VPAYVVAHDTTLAEIADLRPRTLPALRRVRGMGPTKLERYGAEILAVVEGAG